MYVLHINPDKIREVIGPGGKVINEIIAETQTTIDIEQDGTRNHMLNVKKILRELYERRERKITSMAIHRSRLGESAVMDTASLLMQERHLYEKLVQLFLATRKEMLDAVLERKAVPVNTVSPSAAMGQHVLSDEQLSSSTTTTAPAQTAPAAEAVRIKFLKSVPKFLGRNMEVHGPFEENDVAELPSMIANILVSKGRAEKVSTQ